MGASSLRLTPAALALAAIPLAPAAGAGDLVERFTGTARGADGAVLYREEHVVRRTPGRLLGATTTYLGPAGRPIAILRTDFSRDPFAPSYEFEDLRTGAVESVRISEGSIELRAGRRTRTLARLAPASPRVVAGQGLDRFVRHRLDAVAAGEVLSLAYAIPSRLGVYDMRVRAEGGGAGGSTVRVRVEFSSWLLRLLAPSLEVDYDRATRRLLRYRGVSNLAFGDGENPEVEILYAYPEAAGSRSEEPHATR